MTRHLYRSGMDFQVLGPLRASRDGVDCEVHGAKERTLLAHLVAYAGQVVPSTALIESLWGDDPPRSAAKSLQTYVLRLRNSLEPDRHGKPRLLLTDDAGYQLAISPLDTDAGRFSRLAELAGQALAGGRPEAAVEASRDALDLWRGTAYAGCEDTAFGQAEARRLDELRQSVVVTRMEAHLALGRESTVVPELERRVGEHPLRERLWELLMLAYYRSGQQAQALAAYDRVREVLADELGVDPGHGLRELHARILAQDPTLQLARRRATLPLELRDETPLVGRDGELQVLREAWQRTLAGAPATVVVRGPAGAGATRLAAALADEVARDGAAVATSIDGSSTPVDGARDEPWLLVAQQAVARPDRAMLLRLAGPGSTTPEQATVVDLAPLTESEVRRVVGGYVSDRDLDAVSAAVLDSGPAWPGRVHESAARLARETAARRLASAVGVAGEASARLSYARAEVSESIVTLSEAEDPRRCRRARRVPVARPGVVRDRGRSLVRRPRAPRRCSRLAARDHPAARRRRPVGQRQVVGAEGGHARGAGERRAARQLDVAPGRDAAREAPDARARASIAGRAGRRPRRPAGPPDPHGGRRH